MAKELNMQNLERKGDFFESLYSVDLNNRNDEFLYKQEGIMQDKYLNRNHCFHNSMIKIDLFSCCQRILIVSHARVPKRPKGSDTPTRVLHAAKTAF